MARARLIDVSKCQACRGCQVACKEWHNLPTVATEQTGTYQNPPGLNPTTWIVVEFRERPGQWLFRPNTCMHCTDASCERVCPTGAISHQGEDGEAVVIDQTWCIGCGYCVQACPFHVPHVDETTGTSRKCRFCISRITNGYMPACAKSCPPKAIQFGDRQELLTLANERLAVLKSRYGYTNAQLYGEYELGGLHTIYILTDEPSVFGLPESPQLASTNAIGNWVGGFITAGVATIVPIWLLFRRKNLLKTQSKDKGGER